MSAALVNHTRNWLLFNCTPLSTKAILGPQSNPFQSSPVQSIPIQSSPVQQLVKPINHYATCLHACCVAHRHLWSQCRTCHDVSLLVCFLPFVQVLQLVAVMATAQTTRASDGYSAALAVAGFIAHVLEFFGKKQRRRTMCTSVLTVVLCMQLECKFSVSLTAHAHIFGVHSIYVV